MNLLNQPWNVVFLVGFVVYMGIRHVYAKRTLNEEKVHRQVDALEKGLIVAVVIGSLLIPFIYLFSPLLDFAIYRLARFSPWCGTFMMLVALWLFWRSHHDLGKNWSVTLELRKDHRLVKNGVYRAIRHPMYASIWLFSISQALLLQNWLAGCSALVPFAIMYAIRKPREERMMCEFFGQEYEDYMQQTGSLFPRIWRRDSGDLPPE